MRGDRTAEVIGAGTVWYVQRGSGKLIETEYPAGATVELPASPASGCPYSSATR